MTTRGRLTTACSGRRCAPPLMLSVRLVHAHSRKKVMSTPSSKIALIPGERIVMSFAKDIVILTNHRIRYDSTQFGSSKFVSVTLDSVASCSLVTKSLPILLLVAAVALIVPLYTGGHMMDTVVIAIVLVVAYFLTRFTVISIASKGGATIRVPTKGMNRAVVAEFLETVEREKLMRSRGVTESGTVSDGSA